MMTRSTDILSAGAPTPEVIQGMLAEHRQALGRLARLRDYYDGQHDILHRAKPGGVSNNRLMINHAKYITDIASGYLAGRPVGYRDEAQAAALAPLLDAYRRASIDAIDAELAKDASIYGKGVEVLYIDGGIPPRPKSAGLDPRQAFVVYDDTVAHQPLLGLHEVPRMTALGRPDGSDLTVYTATTAYAYSLASPGAVPRYVGEQPHFFGGVPVIEYWNNEDERGDFACVTTLIDAYNTLMSDRLNDKEQLVEAILLITGATLGDDDTAFAKAAQHIRDHRLLELPSQDASASYLVKQLDEASVQVLADALVEDIHKISMVPALTDAHFAGNSSGVAMRYKLFGLEQLTRTKERWFREGLTERLRRFAHALGMLGLPPLDADSVQLVFSRGLPVNDLEQAQMVALLKDIVPGDVLTRQLSFVEGEEA